MKEYTYEQKMLGTEVVLSFITTNKILADQVAEETFIHISNYEKRFSRFNQESELSMLNNQKSLTVSPEFLSVLKRSYELYEETDGVFNPLMQVARLGYRDSFTSLKDRVQPIEQDSYDIDFRAVQINIHTRQVKLRLQQRLDFGGILKGYLAEKLSKGIADQYPAICGNIINLGGDIYSHGVDENNEVFIFLIDNPITGKDIPIALKNTALTTSGTYKRYWSTPVGERNHIVAKDGLSNGRTDYISASVISKDGSWAEAAAKVLLLYGPQALTIENLKPDCTYLVINQSGAITTNIL